MMWQQARHGYHPVGTSPVRISSIVLLIVVIPLILGLML